MNSPKHPAEARALTLRDRLVAWRELVDQCGRKPARKRVHALRVVTLRIQSELEHELAELPRASHQAQAMLRFGKLADKLRQALGPARELDVWIGKLQRLRASLGSTGYVPRSTQDCIRQISGLEERLKRKRRSAGLKLATQITKRRGNLAEAAEAVDELASDRLPGTDAAAVEMILKQFETVAAEFPAFNEENLHDFRKRIKKVRYLAEIHQDTNPACRRIAAQIKKLQTAIGEWHDWQVLASKARPRRHATDLGLADLLDSLTAESYDAAITACHTAKARVAELEAASSRGPNGIRRKPPMPSSHAPAASLEKSA